MTKGEENNICPGQDSGSPITRRQNRQWLKKLQNCSTPVMISWDGCRYFYSSSSNRINTSNVLWKLMRAFKENSFSRCQAVKHLLVFLVVRRNLCKSSWPMTKGCTCSVKVWLFKGLLKLYQFCKYPQKVEEGRCQSFECELISINVFLLFLFRIPSVTVSTILQCHPPYPT